MNYKCTFFMILLLASISLPAFDRADYPRVFEPDPSRFASAIAEFQAADAANPSPKGAIVCTGSSSMRMWHPRIKDDLPGLTLLPRGFGGSHYIGFIGIDNYEAAPSSAQCDAWSSKKFPSARNACTADDGVGGRCCPSNDDNHFERCCATEISSTESSYVMW